ESRPATLFTIHNLVYQGLFPPETFQRLSLPAALWSMHALEFHGQLSFIKGGLAFADRLTTVSPTYAEEICTPQFGAGLHALLSYRRRHLHGILNGVDYATWDPSADPFIAHRYSSRSLGRKSRNRKPLLERFGLKQRDDAP